jgi:peptidyl-prolyl cis-trans isomerase D
MPMYSLVYKNKKFVAGVIGFVSLAFLLWLLWIGGIGDIANIGQNCVAKVDGSCITLRDYRRELLRYGDLSTEQIYGAIVKRASA